MEKKEICQVLYLAAVQPFQMQSTTLVACQPNNKTQQ